MNINNGITEGSRKDIAEGLSVLLADSYTLLLKTHNFHWNVTGPMFQTLHLLFETQYNELFTAVDQIAERIRSLGYPAPASYAQFLKLTSIKEATTVPRAKEMIQELLRDNETVTKTARSLFPKAEAGNDEATLDLLTSRLDVHEKASWMLRSHLEE